VANNKINVTRGSNFDNINYMDPDTMLLGGQDTIAFSVTANPFITTLDRTQITTAPQVLVHVKIEILSCNQSTDIRFHNTVFTSGFTFYTTTPDATNIQTYDDVTYGADLNHLLCVPNITSFTSPVYPGTFYQGTTDTDYLMTIQGTNFGATRGNGNVFFKNANFGGQNHTLLNAYDFLSWTDTEIQIRMPSIIDTTLYSTTTTPVRTPGSGIFYVKNNSGDSVLSSTPVDMPYAIKNAGFPSQPEKKVRMY